MHVHMMTKCSKKHGEEDCSSACMRQLQQGGHVFILFLFDSPAAGLRAYCSKSCKSACIYTGNHRPLHCQTMRE